MDLNTDASRWAFFTELFFLAAHVQCYQRGVAAAAARADVLLLEGSPVTDRLCYFEAQCRARMHPLEAELYMDWYQRLEPTWHVDHHILLMSDMHAHVERIIDNAKVEQASIGLDDVFELIETYVEALPQAHVVQCPANFEDNEPVLENLRAVVAATFGTGWVVARNGEPESLLLQTPKMRAPFGCIETSYGRGGKPKLSIALAVPASSAFMAWYEALEEHTVACVEQKCEEWFGKPCSEVQPSVREAFCAGLKQHDGTGEALLYLNVPTRGSAVLANFFDASGVPDAHTSMERNHELACHIELEGLWFANQRWGMRWRLCSVKMYSDATAAAFATTTNGFAFVADDGDDDGAGCFG
ncbi:hypothetical protein COO60DRAFT_1463561 [Scenedesmus sp. NREL 46B-D3]|nr:hypothetical protein COO60DRAFT_1463561 [Scenedesmus sp. NREL 46B-D3]